VLAAVVAAVLLCAVVAVARLIRRSTSRRRPWPAFAWAVAVALLAAIPIDVFYDDGCNEHQTVSPVVAAPFIVWNRPETSVGSYNDVTTLMACFDGPGPPLEPASLRPRRP
jgi:hypothetical protein